VSRGLALALIAFFVLVFVGPWHRSIRHSVSRGYHDVLNEVHTKYTPVHPISATATTSAPGHPAALAIDGASNTSWQTQAPNDGVGQSLIIRLSAASDLDRIGFLNGDQDTPQAYLTQARPQRIQLTISGPRPYTKDLTLKDTPSFQTFAVSVKGASSLTITVVSVYRSGQGVNAALTEVELFKKG
jgi:hypothetical protein